MKEKGWEKEFGIMERSVYEGKRAEEKEPTKFKLSSAV